MGLRDYAKVAPQFWTGETGRYLREAGRDAQVVALYLITGPNANMIGLYYLALPTLCHEVGISRQGALKALRRPSEGPPKGLQRGSEGGFARYDEVTETVWVPEMARFQIGESLKPKDNRIVGIVREAEAVRNSPFIIDFYEKYRESFHLPEEGPWEGLRRPLEGPSEALRSQEQEQEQDQEQDQEQEHERTGGASAPPARCDLCASLVSYMNQVGGTLFPTRGAYLAMLHARHGESGAAACRRVIRVTAWNWIYEPRRAGNSGGKDMVQFFRPETIFRPKKFPGYLGQADPGDPRVDQFGRLPQNLTPLPQETKP